jgi:hypothetical protein
MTLPPLPRVLKKREAAITTTRIPAFLKKNFPHQNVCFEVKIRGRKVEDHQLAALQQAQEKGYYKKFRDDGSRQDFDGIWMPHPVSVIIWIETTGKLTIQKCG